MPITTRLQTVDAGSSPDRSLTGKNSGRARSLGPAGRTVWTLLAGLTGFLAPLTADLRGGGLLGVGMYDDSVYFAAATGLVHGRLPYRDFLLLHPPGIVIALSPFALIGDLVNDSTGFMAARVFWMLLGGASASLVVAILWDVHPIGGVAGGLFMAFYFPSVNAGHTLVIEQAQNVLLLLAVLILTRALRRSAAPGWRANTPWLLVGLLLGLLPTLKIWGVLPLGLVAAWVVVGAGIRRLAVVAVGIVASGCAVYLPFLVQAPRRMWRYVVTDQINRHAFGTSLLLRLGDLEGLGALRPSFSHLVVIGTGLAWAVAASLALRLALGRIILIGHVVLVVFLLGVPSWISHYPALTAPTAALVIGCATASVATFPRRAVRRIGVTTAWLTILMLVLGQGPRVFGSHFPTHALQPVRATAGCLTADDPTTLIMLDRLNRNLRLGCPLVVDLGGYTYDLLVDGRQRSRIDNPAWQAAALHYLASGSATVISRFSSKRHASFTPASSRVISDWPIITKRGGWVARSTPGGR